MPRPDGGLIQETNLQYYAGAQIIYTSVALTTDYTFNFNTALSLGSTSSWAITDPEFTLNNFRIYTSPTGLGDWSEYLTTYTLTINQVGANQQSVIVLGNAQAIGTYVKVQLKEDAVANNYGGYEYVSLNDIVNNFIVGYVGQDKLIPRVNRTDVIFHAKRGLQEFSYDTLKSIKSQELTIPPSLSIIIPQDYVNYVKLSYIDNVGIKHSIYPTTLTSNPFTVPIQDVDGVPTQDSLGANLEGTSLTNDRWDNNNLFNTNLDQQNSLLFDYSNWYMYRYGRRYGLAPEVAQSNGWFTIDEREGKFSFSSNLAGQLIILEYISDGLSSDLDTKVPKMAEEAMYMHIAHSILAGRSGIQEYVVRRYKIDRRAALRNAKIRLSNIKLEEFTQIMRGKSKILKN